MNLFRRFRRSVADVAAYGVRAGKMLALAAVLTLPTGCGTPYSSSRNETGELHHHNWWNYYAQARTHIDEGRVLEARHDLERCLGIRRGAISVCRQDMWRARTYGVHIMNEYFPNRELGVCLYRLGEIDEATAHLERSLEQQPSGRAKYYLNLCRRLSLKGTRPAPPTITLDPPAVRVWTKDRRRRISGTARGAGYVSGILINGHRKHIELAEREIPFSEDVPLTHGPNTVIVTAEDLAGNRTTRAITWQADWVPPQLDIAEFKRQGGTWTFAGVCHDNQGLQSVTLDGKPVGQFALDKQPQRECAVDGTLARRTVVAFEATDLAGNCLKTVLSVPRLLSPESHRPVMRLAMNPARQDGLMRGTGVSQPSKAGGHQASTDRQRPTLTLNTAGTLLNVQEQEFFLCGRAHDYGGLSAVCVNGERLPLHRKTGSIERHFARRLPLDVGTNILDVVARDLAGNEKREQLTVLRSVPEYRDVEYRLAIAVPPFVPPDADAATAQLERHIEQALLRPPVRFHLVERQHGWDHLIREQALSMSGLADREAALETGRVLTADIMMFGGLSRYGKGVTVYAEIVETATGKTLVMEDVYTESAADDLAYQAEGLVMKIEQQFPLLQARVIKRGPRGVTIDVGAAHGVRVGSRFVVLAEDDADGMATGDVLKCNNQFVQLRVVKTREATGKTEIAPADANHMINEGSIVHTR
ncbi:MAG: hypothetical protein JXR37_08840 [Kiritimatiellae bacterium]|nr:hypothetical protein [Kiritimatiellia bacterium]